MSAATVSVDTDLNQLKRQAKELLVRFRADDPDAKRRVEAYAKPRPGEVYNLGGGRGNSVSMLEAIAKIAAMTGKKLDWKYVDQARKGDHVCYISDLRKFQAHYPNWKITRNLDNIFQEIIAAQQTEHTSGVAR